MILEHVQVAVVAAGGADDAALVADGGLSVGGVDGDDDARHVEAAELDGGEAALLIQARCQTPPSGGRGFCW
ncbi:hypothetical protein [Streptomyces sp. NPDC047009]|uniref:hypothetical protein n=1 Tax=unclassified Streptomyces TaxID=2593676 RepID=UPI0033FD0081